ncbi:MAG: tetratricopeptide repeat protein [Planctomycetes bacterium]|nr:tetratricopeptide repeat protein [Planctomycetota bacterium]
MFPVPEAHQRLADQVDGWLDLRCPDKALELLGPMLADEAARDTGLHLRVRALVRLGRYRDALPDLAELAKRHPDEPWVPLTVGFCLKRTGELRHAITVLRALLERDHRQAIAHFNLACYLALDGQQDAAIDALTLACGIDPEHRLFARDEPDFDSLRTDPRFRQLVRAPGEVDELQDDDLGDLDADDGDDDDDAPPDRHSHRRN